MTDKKYNSGLIIKLLIIALIMGILAFLIWVFTNGNETKTSEEVGVYSYTSLECKGRSSENDFFASETAQQIQHTITVSFKNDVLDNISYVYDGTYRSDSIAETDMAKMHAVYNNYMGENEVYSESLNPIFSAIKTKVKITLFGELKKLKQPTMKLFYLSSDDYQNLDKINAKSLKKSYEGKGFTCTFHE